MDRMYDNNYGEWTQFVRCDQEHVNPYFRDRSTIQRSAVNHLNFLIERKHWQVFNRLFRTSVR